MSDENLTPEGSSLEWVRDFYRKMAGGQRKKSRDERRRDEASKRGSKPFEKGREPEVASKLVSNLVSDYGWQGNMARAELFANWKQLVGEETSAAAEPVDVIGGKLVVRCRSTAWATQLRLLERSIIENLQDDYPDLGITSIQFLGPNAPSWKKGSRSVPGRGPRDTYG